MKNKKFTPDGGNPDRRRNKKEWRKYWDLAYQSIAMAVKKRLPDGTLLTIYFQKGRDPYHEALINFEFFVAYVDEYWWLPGNADNWTGEQLASMMDRLVIHAMIYLSPEDCMKAAELLEKYVVLYGKLTNEFYPLSIPMYLRIVTR